MNDKKNNQNNQQTSNLKQYSDVKKHEKIIKSSENFIAKSIIQISAKQNGNFSEVKILNLFIKVT